MTTCSPQRKRGAGAAWRLACALLIWVHAAAAHERPAAAIAANALVVANEQRTSIDVPSATKSDTGSSSAVLQSVALLYRGATNLAPVVGSALLLASAVPACGTAARSSAWCAPVARYLLVSEGFVSAAAAQDAARDNVINNSPSASARGPSNDNNNNIPSMATGVAPQERRQLTGYVMTDSNIYTARDAWLSDATAAEATYGHISTWDTSGVTDMTHLFCGSSNYIELGCNTAVTSFNENIGAWDTSGVTNMFAMFRNANAFNRDIGDWAVHSVTDMEKMFFGAENFDQDIGEWAVDGVTSMYAMFYNAQAFNQDIGDWALDSVIYMGGMFEFASAFDQDLGWCVDDDVYFLENEIYYVFLLAK
jgi:hypothetical protein